MPSLPAVALKAQQPTLLACGTDLQIQATLLCVTIPARLLSQPRHALDG